MSTKTYRFKQRVETRAPGDKSKTVYSAGQIVEFNAKQAKQFADYIERHNPPAPVEDDDEEPEKDSGSGGDGKSGGSGGNNGQQAK